MPTKAFIVINEDDGTELGRHQFRHDAEAQAEQLKAEGVRASIIREGCCG